MGDVPSAQEPSRASGGERREAPTATVEDLFADLTDLTEDDDTAEAEAEVIDVKHLLAEAYDRGLLESGVRQLRARDAAEAFVGSVIFASPLLVEDGIFDIAEHLFRYTLYGVPVFLIANTMFVVLMTYALLEWTGRNRDDTLLLFGVVPVRLFLVLAISFVVSAILMTVWGRVGDWQPPAEAISRINVLWTVGSLGAALGDIISDSSDSQVVTDHSESVRNAERQALPTDEDADAAGPGPGGAREMSDSALVAALHREFDDLAAVVDSPQEQRDVQRIREETIQATVDDTFNDRIQKYTGRDIAEAFVGSIFFSIPFLVEDGVFDVAEYFLSFTIGPIPVFFAVNATFVVLMILALVYWAGPQNVQVTRPILGLIPRRLVGIAAVSFLTAAALMTMWGRVADWQDPIVALARISVVWTVASFGAALGDILPGESSGDDINDDLAALGDLVTDEEERRERSER